MKFKKRYTIGLFIVLVGCIGIWVAVINRGHSCLDGETNNYFSLPSTAQAIENHSLQLTRSCTLWIKFQIPASDLNTFISTTFIKGRISSTLMPMRIGSVAYLHQMTGWDLNSLNSSLAGEAEGTGERYLDEQFVIVDTSNSTQYTVYLVTKKNWL